MGGLVGGQGALEGAVVRDVLRGYLAVISCVVRGWSGGLSDGCSIVLKKTTDTSYHLAEGFQKITSSKYESKSIYKVLECLFVCL